MTSQVDDLMMLHIFSSLIPELINILSQKDFSDELSDLIDFWENKISYIKKESNEKDETIFSLKEEIMILKSIIDEKDRTIDFLRGE